MRTRTNRRNPESGVTLVELLIATVLLALILLAIAPLFIMSVKSNYSANEYTSIHNIARDRLEQLMSLPFNDPQLARNTAGTSNDLPTRLPDPRTGLPSATSVRNTLTISYTVRLFTDTPPADNAQWILTEVVCSPCNGVPYDFKQIDVTVSSVTGPGPGAPMSVMGIGSRTARVSGFVRNPTPLIGDP